jgi:hypothetical protein
MVETSEARKDARGMAGFCAFGGSMVGLSRLILTALYAFNREPVAAGVFLIAGAIAFGLMSNAFFRR